MRAVEQTVQADHNGNISSSQTILVDSLTEICDPYADATKHGRELLRAGKVGAFIVAGGQGTRLGYEGPKGEYPVTPIRNKPLFQVFAEQLLAHSRRSGKSVVCECLGMLGGVYTGLLDLAASLNVLNLSLCVTFIPSEGRNLPCACGFPSFELVSPRRFLGAEPPGRLE